MTSKLSGEKENKVEEAVDEKVMRQCKIEENTFSVNFIGGNLFYVMPLS